jgi:hypothetical protein
MEKLKLPELKVTSFVTSLSDQQMNQVYGGVIPPDSGDPETPVLCLINPDETQTYCSSSDWNGGVTCSPAVAGCS